MRRLIPVVAALVLAGCGSGSIADDAPLSELRVAEPRAEIQLLSGFHQVEQNAWRWTKGKFAVILEAPADAAKKGARLELRFTLPDAVISRRSPVTLSATVEEQPLMPATYANSGPQTYARVVPASAFSGSAVKIDFALDKFLAAGEIEARELGVIVNSIGLRRN